MAKDPYRTPKFLKLRKEWYKKLESEGFEDIEYTDWTTGQGRNYLKGYGHMDALRFWSEGKQRYWELARQYSWELPQSLAPLWRTVWKLHAEGLSGQDISYRIGIYRTRVEEYIRFERERMLTWANEYLDQETEGIVFDRELDFEELLYGEEA